jgi:hypothetical protein
VPPASSGMLHWRPGAWAGAPCSRRPPVAIRPLWGQQEGEAWVAVGWGWEPPTSSSNRVWEVYLPQQQLEVEGQGQGCMVRWVQGCRRWGGTGPGGRLPPPRRAIGTWGSGTPWTRAACDPVSMCLTESADALDKERAGLCTCFSSVW